MNKNKLIIIGNGFDLHHGMKTKYSDYREFLIKEGHKNIVEAFESNMDSNVNTIDYWNKMEENIGRVKFDLLGDCRCSNEYLGQMINKKFNEMISYWPQIKNNIYDWIKNIDYKNPSSDLKNIITNENYYISFNYTNTLERHYKIKKNNICYIHGDASKTSELVLGHRHEESKPKWPESYEDYNGGLVSTTIANTKFSEETRKKVEEIYKNSCLENVLLQNKFSEIIVLGLSLNETDKYYLEQLCKLCPTAVWTYYCHINPAKKTMNNAENETCNYLRKIGVNIKLCKCKKW